MAGCPSYVAVRISWMPMYSSTCCPRAVRERLFSRTPARWRARRYLVMVEGVSSRQRKGGQHMHDLLQIEVVGSKSDWFLLGLDKYGTVWSGTARPVGATFELDWVQINENIAKKE